MKLRWKVIIGLMAAGILAALALSQRESSEQRALEQTRRDLRAQGFKIDLTEFDFSTSDEFHARVTALTNASSYNVPRSHAEFARRSLLLQVMPELMQPIGHDSAIPIWQQQTWVAGPGVDTYLRLANLPDDVWPALREGFSEDRELLDKACAAALAGPIRIPLNASHGHNLLLPHAAALKNLTQTLGGRVALELHDGHPSAAWTNLLAATRLVTAWETEPVEVSQLVRASCATMVFNITWQVLQTKGWSEEHLSQLRREWESVDFFAALPETAAFGRACASQSCQQEREEPMDSFDPMLRDFFRSPRHAWANFSYRYQRLRYRGHGSYEDEKGLLLYYRDHEQQLKQAVQAQTWSEMRQLPGVTNSTPFRSKHNFSRTMMLLDQRQMMLSVTGQGRGLLGRVAEAEASRRLIITAIALERFHNQHGAYPKSLGQLSPALLKRPPVDFMDGIPLRYRLTDDGHFVLYSVGLDCADDGGQLPQPHRRGNVYEEGFTGPQATDLVWPRPAAPQEVQAKLKKDLREAEEEKRLAEEREAAEEEQAVAFRKATVQKLLTEKRVPRVAEPTYKGKPLGKVLRNERAPDKAVPSLDELLTLKQISTGEEPDIATFEVPVSYDVVTNIGGLRLLVDVDPEESDGPGELQECVRATNGNCLLIWNTTYDPPGQHALQAQLDYIDRSKDWHNEAVRGPVSPFFSSNICQFFPGSSLFDDRGATLYAKLPESNGIYSIELKSPAGILIKTLKGTTSNGVINVEWDLKDENGKTYTNDSLDCVYHVTLPDSGRSQTQKSQ